ncbi:MAG: hypothetical protein D4R45_03235 [Planctomycetaceae bacterium]|nr:MAG: hypothetical protein D4R45_03235 [Planctomycetaceae bacterium]
MTADRDLLIKMVASIEGWERAEQIQIREVLLSGGRYFTTWQDITAAPVSLIETTPQDHHRVSRMMDDLIEIVSPRYIQEMSRAHTGLWILWICDKAGKIYHTAYLPPQDDRDKARLPLANI